MARRKLATTIVIGIGLVLGVGGACKRESFETPRRSIPGPAVPPRAIERPLPDEKAGAQVAAPLLRAAPSAADCRAACDKLIEAELAGYLSRTPDELKKGVRAAIDRLRERERPLCEARCGEKLTRAVTECVRMTDGVSAAVDCLERTGAYGSTTP